MENGRHYIAAFCFALLSSIIIGGCYSFDEISKSEFKEYTGVKKIYLLTNGLDRYIVDKGGYHISSDTVYISGKKIEPDGTDSNFEGKVPMNIIKGIHIVGINAGSVLTITWFSIISILTIFYVFNQE